MSPAEIKTHYSAAELAAMKLPGLPTTKVAFRDKADREQWAFVEKKGIGGTRREYALPAGVMAAIKNKAAKAIASSMNTPSLPARREEQLPLIETEALSLKTDARRGVLQTLELLMQRSGYPMKKAASTLIDMARLGLQEPDDERRGHWLHGPARHRDGEQPAVQLPGARRDREAAPDHLGKRGQEPAWLHRP
ncbi:DNA-binding protein [Neisseriaceae bacterium JH1-16]|nr:DNA-binding protein [Neisseriaceae bacterium JH1-16]